MVTNPPSGELESIRRPAGRLKPRGVLEQWPTVEKNRLEATLHPPNASMPSPTGSMPPGKVALCLALRILYPTRPRTRRARPPKGTGTDRPGMPLEVRGIAPRRRLLSQISRVVPEDGLLPEDLVAVAAELQERFRPTAEASHRVASAWSPTSRALPVRCPQCGADSGQAESDAADSPLDPATAGKRRVIGGTDGEPPDGVSAMRL